MEALEPLVGEWTAEAVMPGGDGDARGSMTVEWLEGGGYLIQRSVMEDRGLPAHRGRDRPRPVGREDRPALLRLPWRRPRL